MLKEFHEAFVENIKNNIVGLAICEAYPRIKKAIQLPAVLFEIEEFEEIAETEEGKTKFLCHCVARCILDTNDITDEKLTYEMSSRDLAAKVAMQIIKGGRLGLKGVSSPMNLRSAEDGFKPELDGYNVWAVEFDIYIEAGDSVFECPDFVTPTTIFLGFSPKIGEGHEQDYFQVSP